MGPILSLIDQTTNSSLPGGIFPTPLSCAFHLLNRIHWIWCWKVQYLTVFTNANNFKKYLGGTALNLVAGHSALLRNAAHAVLILRRLLDCGKQKVIVYKSWIALKEAFSRDYLPQVQLSIDPSLQSSLSPSTHLWLTMQRQVWSLRLQRIARCLQQLFWELLQLSVCYRLTLEAFSLNPHVQTAAVNELFLHSTHVLEELTSNRKKIHAELLHNQELLQKVLSLLHINLKATQLIGAVGSSLSLLEYTYSGANHLYRQSAEGIKDGLWTFLNGHFGWAPRFLLPES